MIPRAMLKGLGLDPDQLEGEVKRATDAAVKMGEALQQMCDDIAYIKQKLDKIYPPEPIVYVEGRGTNITQPEPTYRVPLTTDGRP